ncbi:hypothetical protein GGF32_005653 [Allomyces javanicus]|nr:hypothetical protein GGF32_005653 [Allomyces javanicus]
MDARPAPASTMPPPQPAPLRPALPVDPLPAPFNSSLPPAWASWVEQLIVHHVHHIAMTQAAGMHDAPSSSRAPAAAAAVDTSGHDSGNDGSPDPPPTGELHTPSDDPRNPATAPAAAAADPHPESVSGLALRVHDLELMVHELQTVVGALRRDMYPFKAAHEKKYSRIISHVRKLQMSLHDVGNQVDDLLGPEPVQDATDGPTGPRVRIQLPDGGPPVLTSADPELRPVGLQQQQQGAASALQDLQYLLIHHDDPAFTEQLRMQARREHELAAAAAAGPVVAAVEQQQQPWWVTAPVPAAAVSATAPAQAPPATWYPNATAPPGATDPVARAAEHHLHQLAPAAAAVPVAPESRLGDKTEAIGIVPPPPPHSPRAPLADRHHLPTPPQERSAPPTTTATAAAVAPAARGAPIVRDTPPSSSSSVASSTNSVPAAPVSSAPAAAAPAGPHVSSLPAPLTPTPPGSVDTLARAGLAKVATMIRMFDRALAPRQAVLIPAQDDDEDRPLAAGAEASELAPPTRPLPPPPASQPHVLAWPSLAESTGTATRGATAGLLVPARGGTIGRRGSS